MPPNKVVVSSHSTTRRIPRGDSTPSSSTSTIRRVTCYIQGHTSFYAAAGLRRVTERVHPGGVLAVWLNDPPDEKFMALLAESFAEVKTEIVSFDNPLQEREAANTIYLARTAPLE